MGPYVREGIEGILQALAFKRVGYLTLLMYFLVLSMPVSIEDNIPSYVPENY